MTTQRLCLIGDVMVDVMMTSPVKMRLGGIFHAARTCWALGVPFDLLYVAPDYLVEDIKNFALQLGASSVVQIGSVTGAPNVVVIKETTEAGSQGYEYLLRDQYHCNFIADLTGNIPRSTDLLVFPGSYELQSVLEACYNKGDVALDLANWNGAITDLREFQISTAISSTSSPTFIDTFKADVGDFRAACLDISATLLFKENRGGSRIFHLNEVVNIGAQLRPIAHSVGVGDCFNVAFLARHRRSSEIVAGNFAARIAAEYAATTYPSEFEMGAKVVSALADDILSEEQGILVPWESRVAINVYIAAPDFEYNDRTHIDAIAESLRYHNFKPRLPIRENGRASPNDSIRQKRVMFDDDMRVLNECQILVAVLIDSDPGTMIELGLAAGMGMPTVVYDPYGLATNVMLACLPNSVCSTLDEAISAVFTHVAGR